MQRPRYHCSAAIITIPTVLPMTDHDTARFPEHHIIVSTDNIEQVRRTLPDDQQSQIKLRCLVWRMPIGVDTWLEPCGSTLTYWPDTQRGALCHDGDPDGSSWGTWRGGELHLDDGLAVDVHGRVLHVWLGSGSVETHNHETGI